MTARRLTHLTARLLLTLPLAACAAQPGPEQAAGQPDARSAAAAPSPAPASAATPAAPVSPATQAGADARQAGAAAPRHAESGRASHAGGNVTAATGTASGRTAESGVSATGTSGTGTSATGTSANGAAAAGASVTGAPATGMSASSAPAAGTAAATTAPDVVAPHPATPGAAVPPVTMPAGSPTGGLLQTLFALILVLAVLGALAWFLKRYGPRAGGGNAHLRVVGSLNLGGRERIMVVEVGNQWIVVGASPGRINALATLPRQDGQNGDTDAAGATLARQDNAAPGAHSFADWLKQTIDKRK